jgi:hypothetical protein
MRAHAGFAWAHEPHSLPECRSSLGCPSGCANGYYKAADGSCRPCLDGTSSTTGVTATCTCGTGGSTYTAGTYTTQGCRE